MYYEVKCKISSTLVQLTAHFFNETSEWQQNLKDLKKRQE